MNDKIIITKVAICIAILSGVHSKAFAHGWSEFPNARQNVCYEQGGIWSGSPPNAACANAKNISGTYPFVQRNEYSINVADYYNIDAVKSAIPDGTLCYANDPQKQGMGAPHTGWTRTELGTGTFEYIFNATAPHNPSFWEFYLTKPDADLSKGLAWGDLDLIQTAGNIAVNGGKYLINVDIPPGRSGDAILFVRWQRDDAGGEGFYNCSDITIIGGTTPPPDPPPEEQLHRGEFYIPGDLEPPEIGDVVNYDIINKNGEVARSFDIQISASNFDDWERLLASEINGWHAEFKDGAVFIGDWNEEMLHYMYFQDDPYRNYFNSRDSRASGLMTVIKYSDVVPLEGNIYELSLSDNLVDAGAHVVIVMEEAAMLSQTQGTPVQIENNSSSSVIIDTGAVTQTSTLTFSAAALNSDSSATFSFEVRAGATPPPPITAPDWDPSVTYLGGEIVTYADQFWKAQWWVRGGDDPETTYSNDIWGVWRPANW